VLIANPHAAGVDPRLRRLVVAALAGRYDVEAIVTDAPHHAIGLAGAAARGGADAVVTLGGDGTVNEAANGLAGTDVPLIPLPGGSQNVFAKMLGLPGDLVDAAERVLHLADDWRTRRVDLGRVNGRVFTFSAGAGLDASVVEHVDAHPERKARWRQGYYMTSAARVFVTRYLVNAPRIVAEAPGRDPVEGVTALVQNGDPYTYSGRRPIRVCRRSALDSGTLSVAVLRRSGPLDMPAIGARLLSERLEVTGARHVSALEGVPACTLRAADAARPFHLQVDGDPLGPCTEADFDVLAGALAVPDLRAGGAGAGAQADGVTR
jgi:diacylglycerol kinase family enzyme